MKYLTILFNKMYWIAVACVPLLPVCVLQSNDSSPACADNGVCFHFGYPLNTEGEAIFVLSVLLLWPMCVWQIVLKHVGLASGAPSTTARESARHSPGAGHITKIISALYWLVVSSIPLFLWYLFSTFKAPQDCLAFRTCFQYALPLDGKCVAAVVLAGTVLWPMCIWKLAGRFSP